ncbi:MAG: DUF4097 family beta strand repeat-containing protein [Oscillospiraceae bacterium]
MLNKLTKASIILIPFGIVVSIIGGVIMAMNEQPPTAIDTPIVDQTELAETSIVFEEMVDEGLNFAQNEADSIVINCTAANIELYQSENYAIQSDYSYEKEFAVSCEDGVINVNYNKEKITDFEPDFDGGDISIGIPRSCKSIKIQCNFGDITVEEFMGNNIDISIDCGNVSINNCTVSESCKIKNTLGNVSTFNSQISNLDANLVSGNLDVYETFLSGNNKAEVNVGNAEFTLDGYPSDYSIKANVKVGEIECDHNLDDYTNSNNTIDISVLAGNCSIEYYDYD